MEFRGRDESEASLVLMVCPQGPETPLLRLLMASHRHSWNASRKAEGLASPYPAPGPGLGVDGPFLPPCRLLKYREFRRCWSPGQAGNFPTVGNVQLGVAGNVQLGVEEGRASRS